MMHYEIFCLFRKKKCIIPQNVDIVPKIWYSHNDKQMKKICKISARMSSESLSATKEVPKSQDFRAFSLFFSLFVVNGVVTDLDFDPCRIIVYSTF